MGNSTGIWSGMGMGSEKWVCMAGCGLKCTHTHTHNHKYSIACSLESRNMPHQMEYRRKVYAPTSIYRNFH